MRNDLIKNKIGAIIVQDGKIEYIDSEVKKMFEKLELQQISNNSSKTWERLGISLYSLKFILLNKPAHLIVFINKDKILLKKEDLPEKDYKKLKYLCKLKKISLQEKIKEFIEDDINSAEIANF